MDLGIGGRTAAVAAASSGLGLASAKALAAEGVAVAATTDVDVVEPVREHIGIGDGVEVPAVDVIGIVRPATATVHRTTPRQSIVMPQFSAP